MKPTDVSIERNSTGIYAVCEIMFPNGPQTITIWSKNGRYAEQYQSMSDMEIATLAFDEYVEMMKASILSELGQQGGSATSEAKKRSSAENGKRGGRPRKSE